jgi:putative transposase
MFIAIWYYQWRDQFLAHAANAFEVHQHPKKEALLAQENARLKRPVGELTLELKKSDELLGLKRRRSLQVTQRDEVLRPRIQALKAEHPSWGYRRIWASGRCVEFLSVNKKRILRLMREHHLVVTPHLRRKAKRTPAGRKPKPTKPDEWWGIDMMKVLAAGFGGVSIVVVFDWNTKAIVGYRAGIRCTSKRWLAALDMAVNGQFPSGVRDQGLSRMSDNCCQPTSIVFMEACSTLEIHQAFTSYNNPKGNADTERCMRTLKEECLWLQDWSCPFQLINMLGSWIEDYNEHYLHSALGYKTPRQFEQEYHRSHSPPFAAA